MNPLQLREGEIFAAVNRLDVAFVLIGGYAVNAYTLPRFSVDCDIVVRILDDAEKIIENLHSIGYAKISSTENEIYSGNFIRCEKRIIDNFIVSMDILFKSVLDRQT